MLTNSNFVPVKSTTGRQMETKYPTLKRPKRKLCYITEKESSCKQWNGAFSLEDVDKMFDDMDVHTLDLRPPSALLQSSDSGTTQSDKSISPVLQKQDKPEQHPGPRISLCSVGEDEGVLHPFTESPDSKLNVCLDVPFKMHEPVKTSSPIEQILSTNGTEERDDTNNDAVSPILLNFDGKGAQEPKIDLLPSQEPQCNDEITEKNTNYLESPPSMITLPRKFSHKEVEKPSCSHESAEPSAPAVRNKPELFAPDKKTGRVSTQASAETSSRVGKDRTAFLERLRMAVQSKPTRKSLVHTPPPPPPPPPPQQEEDFLILEDDVPLWVTIPSKTTTTRTKRQSKNSSTDKESSSDKGSKVSPPEQPPEHPSPSPQQEVEKANNKQDGHANNQKVKKKREKEKNNELIGSRNEKDSLPSLDVPPAGDWTEQQKPKKKKQQPKKVPSKAIDEVKDPPDDRADVETPEPQKAETKADKHTKRKMSQRGTIITSTSKTRTVKGSRKRLQGSDAAKEAADVDADGEQMQKKSEEEPLDTENLDLFLEKEMKTSEANGELVRESSSSEDVQVKRRRKPVGQWWLSSKSSEGTKNPTLPKRSKPKRKDPGAAAPSTGQADKDDVYKRRNQKQSALLSSDNMNKVKRTRTKQTPKRKAEEEKMNESGEIFPAVESEQEIPDGDHDQDRSSPLVFTQRDVSFRSGDHLFQNVYQKSTNEKLSTPRAPVTPRQPEDQQNQEAVSAKRRRKPPDNWWQIKTSNSAQRLHPKEEKPQKEKKKQSKPRKPRVSDPKNSNLTTGSKPPGGAPATPQILPSAPKTVKRSLATFKDIFTSVSETPTVLASRDAHQSSRRNVTSRPAVEARDTDALTRNMTDKDTLSGGAGEFRDTQDRGCREEDTLKLFRSGPSSMVELENCENNEVIDLSPSRVQTVLSAADLCAPPLKPLTLHSKDKSNLTEWFQSLWSSSADDGATVTPDQFQWYFYQDRALGIQVDLNSSSVCSGKILMGSYMKKPLWVDHSATTVFNLLTSSVSVTVDSRVSRYSPGQAFMVECGKAYSIHNTNAQPAVLYFTRMLAESSN